MQVLVRDNNVDQALKALKKKMQREGIFREMKLRGHYEKPSERKAREKAEAIRRARKLARKRLQREGLLPMKPKPGHCRRRWRPLRSASRASLRLRHSSAPRRHRASSNGRPWRSDVDRVNLLVLGLSALGLLALTACSRAKQSWRLRTTKRRSRRPNPIVASLSEVIQKHPDDPQAYNMRGSVLADAGNADAALSDFNKAISLDPNYAQAYANRGLLHRQSGKLELALADYNKALSIDGNYAAAYLGRGIVHRQQGSHVQALADLNKAIALRPDNAQAYYNRGLLYQSQRQHQVAVDDFTTALGLTTQKADLFVARALSNLALGDPKAAASDLDEAVQMQPQNCRPGRAAGLPTSASATRKRPPALTPRRLTSTTHTSRRKRVSPGSAARSGNLPDVLRCGRGADADSKD